MRDGLWDVSRRSVMDGSPFQDPFRKPPFVKYPAGPGTGSTRLNVCGIRLRIKQAD